MKLFLRDPRVAAATLTSLAALGIAVSAALTTPLRPVAAAVPKADVTQVKALYAEKCSACHNLPVPNEKGYTRQEWQRTVNTMLTKYHASESIAPGEAAQIVDYLATFAPKTATGSGGRRGGDPWAADSTDVWNDTPSVSRVFNFEAGGLAGLAPTGSGVSGPAPVCSVQQDRPGADGLVAHVSGPNFHPDRFAVLLDRADQGRNIDIHVRFRIDSGKASPAVGIAFAYVSPTQYTVLRCNQALGDLALIQIAGPTHTTLQQTAIILPAVPAPPSPAPSAPAATPLAPGWHTLRLLAHDGQVRGWIDMQKRISTSLSSYTGGKVGLWTQGSTSASFDDWIVDCYDAPSTAPAPLS